MQLEDIPKLGQINMRLKDKRQRDLQRANNYSEEQRNAFL